MILNDYVECHNISLRRDRNPGEVLELDWSGSAITMHGKAPGMEVKCHLFVAAFPFSGYFYAEAFADEKIHSWVKGIADSLSFFGGVPVILRPDNTKTATIKADRYEPELNETMIELSEYYRTVTIPARVRKPRDKNVVENSVGFASTYIIQRSGTRSSTVPRTSTMPFMKRCWNSTMSLLQRKAVAAVFSSWKRRSRT